jgi:hypothetical protein
MGTGDSLRYGDPAEYTEEMGAKARRDESLRTALGELNE